MQIKFRGWSEAQNKMFFADICEIEEMIDWVDWDKPADSPTNTGIGFELMQFTGLKDKNGVDIYVGDIVTMHTEWSGGYLDDDSGEHENKGVVAIVPSKGVMINKCMKRDLIECDAEWSKTWTVNVRSCRTTIIGNIHQNKEMLNE